MPATLPFLSFPFNSILLFHFLLSQEYTTAQELGVASLLGPPKIKCEESSILVSLLTSEPFEGNVYAKGFFDNDNCKVKGDSSGNTVNITIPLSTICGMRRRRIINPKGIALEMTMVLMLHPMFLTRNDQAFNIKCVYVEVSQKFTNQLIFTSDRQSPEEDLTVESEARLPKCKYEVLNEESKPLIFGAIGQPIIHRWSCAPESDEDGSTSTSTEYCLTVHTCTIDDGHGNEQKLLDYNGCPVDKSLMKGPDYEKDMQAITKSLIFKFADKPTVFFSCQLRLEPKGDFNGKCVRIDCPPPAPSLKTSAEQFARTSISFDTDFPHPRVTVAPGEGSVEVVRLKNVSIFTTGLTEQERLFEPDQLPEEETVPSNDSLDSTHQVRQQTNLKTGGSTDIRQHQIPLASLSSGNALTSKKAADSPTTLFPSIVTTEGFEKQEDSPLPASASLHRELVQGNQFSTDDGKEESSSESAERSTTSAERSTKLASVETRQKAVEIDVNTPLSVLDLPPFDSEDLIPPKAQRNIIDMSTTSKQVCISRQVLSALVLASAIIFLLISFVFGAVLWKFVRRPRVLMIPRQEPFVDLHYGHGDRRLLSAFHA